MTTYLRTANKQDIDFLFALANDPICRKNSLNTIVIKYLDHKEWFEKKLGTKESQIFIYSNEANESLGQARMDFKGNLAYISYSIIQNARGMGHGKVIIQLLEEEAKKIPKIDKLYAKVKHNNVASKKIFEGLGYECRVEKDYIEFIKNMKLI